MGSEGKHSDNPGILPVPTLEYTLRFGGPIGVAEPPRLSFSGASGRRGVRSEYGPNESRRILKNMIMLGFSFTLIFTAFMAMANLQSSINSKGGIGMDALAALYAAFSLSSLLLPSIFLANLKSKMTLVCAVSGYAVYEFAQFYPKLEVLLPAALYMGACSAQLWAAQGTYLTLIAEEYSYLKSEKAETVLQKFFGVFFLCFHSSQVWGNMISSFVLSGGPSKSLNGTHNTTMNNSVSKNFSHCGVHYNPTIVTLIDRDNASEELKVEDLVHRPETWKIHMLTAIYCGCTIAAGLVIFFVVDSLKRYGEDERDLIGMTKWYSLLVATVKHWRKPCQVLLFPLSVWLGVQEAFIGSDFTAGYIACAWGVENIGFVMMCFGVCASLSSIIIGRVMEYVGRPIVFLTAASLNVACLVTLLYWEPNTAQPLIYFVISGAWGLADGVWSPQIKALYGTLFSETREAAFSNAGLWWAIGFMVVYLNANRIPMETKLHIYIGFIILATIGYICVEVLTRLSTRGKDSTESSE